MAVFQNYQQFRRCQMDKVFFGKKLQAANQCFTVSFFYGLPEMPVEDVSIRDVIVELGDGYVEECGMMANSPELVKAGFFLRNANNVELRDVQLVNAATETMLIDESVHMAE